MSKRDRERKEEGIEDILTVIRHMIMNDNNNKIK